MCCSDVNNPLGSQLISFDWNCLCDKYYYCNTCSPQNPSLQTTHTVFDFSLSLTRFHPWLRYVASALRIKTLPVVQRRAWVCVSLVLTALPGWVSGFLPEHRDRSDPKTDKNCPASHRFTLITMLIIDECSIPAFPAETRGWSCSGGQRLSEPFFCPAMRRSKHMWWQTQNGQYNHSLGG